MKKYKRTKTDHFKKLGFGGLLRRGHVQKKAVIPIYVFVLYQGREEKRIFRGNESC